jgi:hypothetical protein
MDNEIFDFGFSMASEDEVKKAEKDSLNKRTTELVDTQRKLEGLKNMIWPFLEGLKKDPLKSYIHWPNRSEKVDEFMRKIEAYISESK